MNLTKTITLSLITLIVLVGTIYAIEYHVLEDSPLYKNPKVVEASTLLASDITAMEEQEEPRPEPSASPTSTPSPTPTLNKVEAYIHKVFGENAERGIKMLKECENGKLNPTAINWNRNGTWDYGVWQINSIHGHTQEQLADPYFNTDVAYKIFKGWGNTFSAWTCAEVAGDVPFWKK